MKRGDTFLFDPTGGTNRHLFIVMTDPSRSGGKFVMFNLTESSGRPNTFTLGIGDHPFVKKYPSDVNFADGLIVRVERLQERVNNRQALPHDPMDPYLVERIARFALSHPAVTREMQRLIRDDWG